MKLYHLEKCTYLSVYNIHVGVISIFLYFYIFEKFLAAYTYMYTYLCLNKAI